MNDRIIECELWTIASIQLVFHLYTYLAPCLAFFFCLEDRVFHFACYLFISTFLFIVIPIPWIVYLVLLFFVNTKTLHVFILICTLGLYRLLSLYTGISMHKEVCLFRTISSSCLNCRQIIWGLNLAYRSWLPDKAQDIMCTYSYCVISSS